MKKPKPKRRKPKPRKPPRIVRRVPDWLMNIIEPK